MQRGQWGLTELNFKAHKTVSSTGVASHELLEGSEVDVDVSSFRSSSENQDLVSHFSIVCRVVFALIYCNHSSSRVMFGLETTDNLQTLYTE